MNFDLIAVFQDRPLHALAVHEHSVEAAIVEQAHPVGLTPEQRVPARHGRVIQAQIAGQAAPNPGPLAGERHHFLVPVLAEREILARSLNLFPDLSELHWIDQIVDMQAA